MLYREWASKVNNRKGRMVTLDTLDTLLKLRDPGYASVYMFDEAAAKEIAESGSSKGLSKYSVAANRLTLDIDTGDEGLTEVMRVLNMRGLACEIWSSGGKGYHVYIPHPLIISEHLPNSHREAVKALGLTGVDPSLYQHGRLISLPGRVHPKTGKKKRFLHLNDGDLLNIPIIPDTKPVYNFDVNKDLDMLSIGLWRVQDLIDMPPGPGERHTRIWGASKDLAGAGLSYETVLDIMQRANEQWEIPKSEDEVALAVGQAFKT